MIVSILIAIIGVVSARALARQKATLDLIEKAESSDFYKDLNAAFSATRRGGAWQALHKPATLDQTVARQKILDDLNHYERVSIGIRASILDGPFYRKWMLGPFVRDWNAAAGFIQKERWKYDAATTRWSYHKALYENYQHVASRRQSRAGQRAAPWPDRTAMI